MLPYGSLEVQQIPKNHNALINVFKFIRYVYIKRGITLTSSLRFLYIFDRSGLLCAMPGLLGGILHVFALYALDFRHLHNKKGLLLAFFCGCSETQVVFSHFTIFSTKN